MCGSIGAPIVVRRTLPLVEQHRGEFSTNSFLHHSPVSLRTRGKCVLGMKTMLLAVLPAYGVTIFECGRVPCFPWKPIISALFSTSTLVSPPKTGSAWACRSARELSSVRSERRRCGYCVLKVSVLHDLRQDNTPDRAPSVFSGMCEMVLPITRPTSCRRRPRDRGQEARSMSLLLLIHTIVPWLRCAPQGSSTSSGYLRRI